MSTGKILNKNVGYMSAPQESEGEVFKEDLVEEVVEPADWSFTDILIPIPGCRVKWGSSGIKEWFTGLHHLTVS